MLGINVLSVLHKVKNGDRTNYTNTQWSDNNCGVECPVKFYIYTQSKKNAEKSLIDLEIISQRFDYTNCFQNEIHEKFQKPLILATKQTIYS